MGVVGGGFRNLRLKSLAAACSLSRPSFIVFLLAILSTERARYGGVAAECSGRRRLAGGSPRVGIAAAPRRRRYARPPLLHASPPSLYLAERGWCRNARGMLSRVRERRELPPLIFDFGHVEFRSPISQHAPNGGRDLQGGLKSLATASSLPIPSSSSSSPSSPPNGASRRSAQVGDGLRVVLLAGESLEA